jgi:spore coat protein U-like protein
MRVSPHKSALAALLFAALAASPVLAPVQPAEAGQKTQTFTVSTKLQIGCTFVVANMTFPNYTSGQSTVDDGTSSFSIFCASATAGVPVPVVYTVSAPGGFQMKNGANPLNYELCFDAACTQQIPNGVGSGLLVDRQLYTANYYGEIFANQREPAGHYAQTVNVTIQF